LAARNTEWPETDENALLKFIHTNKFMGIKKEPEFISFLIKHLLDPVMIEGLWV
jgi:hypothetical protein